MVLPVDPPAEGELGLCVVLPPDADGVAAFDQPTAGGYQRDSLDLSEVELKERKKVKTRAGKKERKKLGKKKEGRKERKKERKKEG